MTDVEKESINMRLDAICKKLYERAKPTENFDLDALCNYEIIDKIELLENMVNAWWGLEEKMMKSDIEGLEYGRKWLEAKEKISELEKELSESAQNKKIRKLEATLFYYETLAKAGEPGYSMIKTKKGNTNAMRKDIDPVKVYRLVEGGMSITKVAEKFHACRATIRKYYTLSDSTHNTYFIVIFLSIKVLHT